LPTSAVVILHCIQQGLERFLLG